MLFLLVALSCQLQIRYMGPVLRGVAETIVNGSHTIKRHLSRIQAVST